MSQSIVLVGHLVLGVGLLISLSVGEGRTVPRHKSAPRSASHRADPKCTFLRQEYLRIKGDGESYVESSSLSDVSQLAQRSEYGKTTEDLADYVAETESNAAKLTAISANIRSCDRGQRLSAIERLPLLEVVRKRHISRVVSRWVQLGGTQDDEMCRVIVNRVNRVYDDEAKSFYNFDTVKIPLDTDVIKDYPNILSLLQASSVPGEQKLFFQENARYLKYEEAGRLFNILSGTDKEDTLLG